MKGGEENFFGRLEKLEQARQAQAVFDQVIARPIPLPAQEFFPHLLRTLLENLLEWLGLPAGPGALLREWHPLWRLAAEIDPFYFSEEQIARRLVQCPPTSPAQREGLREILWRFFDLRRSGFLPEFPAPLVSASDCARWAAMFPTEFAWRSLAVLRAVGLFPLGSGQGYRAYRRFEAGTFDPSPGPGELQEWMRLCSDGLPGDPADEPDAAHRREFLAAAFGGGFAHLGLAGWCEEVPRCSDCPLRPGCSWARSPAHLAEGSAEIQGRVNLGQLSHLNVGQLLQGLFGSTGLGAAEIAEGPGATPLRRLATKSRPELEEWAEAAGLKPEQLRILFEVCRRFNEERLSPGVPLTSPAEIYRHFRMALRELKQEQFLVVMLDSQRRYLGEALVSQGTLTSSPVHPREVFSAAIRERAAAVLVVHNHPSGDPTPSADDLSVTQRLAEVGEVVGIPVVDHVIIAEDGYTSLRESGKMKR